MEPHACWKIRGKILTLTDIERIRNLSIRHKAGSRRFLSMQVCESFDWKQPNGKPQDVACREILRRLETRGLIQLPAAIHNGHNDRRRAVISRQELPLASSPAPLMEGNLPDFGPASLRLVSAPHEARCWARLIENHHYLGYKPMVGRSLKYFVDLAGRLVGAISWGSPCWKLGPRDSFIGWNPMVRTRNLQLLAGNHRFLILPSVRVKNLASHILSRAVRQAAIDWQRLYGINLSLLESFVDPERFRGSSYKAANWIYLGKSKGSSKSGNSYRFHGHVKDIYVYPLTSDFKSTLLSG